MSDEYLIQDSRSYVGNCVLWWREHGRGYTTDIDDAGRFTEEVARQVHLLKRFRVHEVEVLAVVVKVLHFMLFKSRLLNAVFRGEAMLHHGARGEFAHLNLDKAAEVARGAVLRLHHEVGLAVELDDLAFADVVGCGHGGR